MAMAGTLTLKVENVLLVRRLRFRREQVSDHSSQLSTVSISQVCFGLLINTHETL